MIFLRVGNQVGLQQAGLGRGQRGDGQRVEPAVHRNLLEQVGAADGKAHADAGHAIELGEGAQHDDVLAFLHKVERARRVAKVDVGLVDQQDRVLGRVGNGVLNVGARRCRCRWDCWGCRCR